MAGQRGRFAKYLIADLRDAVERPGVVLGLVLSAVGGLLVLVGLLGAILVGPSSTWHAGRTVKPNAPALILTQGVVGAVGPQLTVTVRRVDGGPLFVGRAISRDVTDLTGNAPRVIVSGVHPLHRLSSTTKPGTTALAPVQTSDIWRDTSVGPGERSLLWHPDSEPQSVLVATTDGSALPAVRIRVSWHRSGWFPAALLVLLVGLAVLTAGLHRLTGGRLLRRALDRAFGLLSRIPMPARRGPVRDDSSQVVR